MNKLLLQSSAFGRGGADRVPAPSCARLGLMDVPGGRKQPRVEVPLAGRSALVALAFFSNRFRFVPMAMRALNTRFNRQGGRA